MFMRLVHGIGHAIDKVIAKNHKNSSHLVLMREAADQAHSNFAGDAFNKVFERYWVVYDEAVSLKLIEGTPAFEYYIADEMHGALVQQIDHFTKVDKIVKDTRAELAGNMVEDQHAITVARAQRMSMFSVDPGSPDSPGPRPSMSSSHDQFAAHLRRRTKAFGLASPDHRVHRRFLHHQDPALISWLADFMVDLEQDPSVDEDLKNKIKGKIYPPAELDLQAWLADIHARIEASTTLEDLTTPPARSLDAISAPRAHTWLEKLSEVSTANHNDDDEADVHSLVALKSKLLDVFSPDSKTQELLERQSSLKRILVPGQTACQTYDPTVNHVDVLNSRRLETIISDGNGETLQQYVPRSAWPHCPPKGSASTVHTPRPHTVGCPWRTFSCQTFPCPCWRSKCSPFSAGDEKRHSQLRRANITHANPSAPFRVRYTTVGTSIWIAMLITHLALVIVGSLCLAYSLQRFARHRRKR